jgi:hypothetical protein
VDLAIHRRDFPPHRPRHGPPGFAQGGGPQGVVQADSCVDRRHIGDGNRDDGVRVISDISFSCHNLLIVLLRL